jgi:hypothetical protein
MHPRNMGDEVFDGVILGTDRAFRAEPQHWLRVMVDAMEQRNLEPVIIEDLVKYGEEIGEQKGLDKGELKEARKALRRVLARKQLVLSGEQEQLIDACDKLEQLETWHDDAVLATSCEEVFRGTGSPVPS